MALETRQVCPLSLLILRLLGSFFFLKKGYLGNVESCLAFPYRKAFPIRTDGLASMCGLFQAALVPGNFYWKGKYCAVSVQMCFAVENHEEPGVC